MALVERLRFLLGAEDDTGIDVLLRLVLELTERFICRYCRVAAVPEELEDVQLLMARDVYRLWGLGKEELPAGVKSLTEGKIRVDFRDDAALAAQESLLFHRYAAQLEPYRKMGW